MTPPVTAVSGVRLGTRIGAGGEAEVFEVEGRQSLVCKVFRQPTPARAEKLRVMLEHPPEGAAAGGHISIAWPVELVVGPRGEVTGFLMPRIDITAAIPLFQVYNPSTRLRVAPGFSYRYLVRAARNVAACVEAIHRAGHVVGDLNESNLLVDRRALVAVVDCDSMQIADPATGRIHRSTVGKPEFLAPELANRDLSTTDRTTKSDAFALAVLVHQLLQEGVHPHAGIWRGRGDPPDVATRIARGWTAARRGWSPVDRPPFSLSPRSLPRGIRRMFRAAFRRRPGRRPEPGEWVLALESLERSLRTCRRSAHHLYAGRSCPWCARIDRGLPDPFPGPDGQSTLSPRPPPAVHRMVRAARRGITAAGRGALDRARYTRVPATAVALGAVGWAWPWIAPAVLAGAVLPLLFCLLTPSPRLPGAIASSARLFVTSAAASAGLVAQFVDWPAVVPVASATAAVVHGLAVPASAPAWSRARARLRRVPTVLTWVLAVAAVVSARRYGW